MQNSGSPFLGIKQKFLGAPLVLGLGQLLRELVLGLGFCSTGVGHGYIHYLLLLGEHLFGGLDLLRNAQPQLVHQFNQLVLVHHQAAGNGHNLAVIDENFQSVDDIYNVYDVPLSPHHPLRGRNSKFSVNCVGYLGRYHFRNISAKAGHFF